MSVSIWSAERWSDLGDEEPPPRCFRLRRRVKECPIIFRVNFVTRLPRPGFKECPLRVNFVEYFLFGLLARFPRPGFKGCPLWLTINIKQENYIYCEKIELNISY